MKSIKIVKKMQNMSIATKKMKMKMIRMKMKA